MKTKTSKSKGKSKGRTTRTLLLPKFFQPKLDLVQQVDCKLAHWDLITRISSGKATTADFWGWLETGLIYYRMIEQLTKDGVQLTQDAALAVATQLDNYSAIIDRYKATGKIGFTGPELQSARNAAVVFDELVAIDRHGIAAGAAQWSQDLKAQVVAEFQPDHHRALPHHAPNVSPPPDIRDTPPATNVSPPLTLETQPVCQMSAKQRIEPMELID